MRKICIAIFLFFIMCISHAQMQPAVQGYSPYTTREARQKLHKKLVDSTINQNLKLPVTKDNEGLWNHAFWGTEILLYHSDFVKKQFDGAWKQINTTSEFFQKNFLEACYTGYPSAYTREVKLLMQTNITVPVFIRCAEYILQKDKSEATASDIADLILQKYKNSDHIGLSILQNRLRNLNKFIPLPPLQDFFSSNFLRGQTLVFSIQRKDRDYPGLVLIRKPDGNFLYNSNGSLFHTAQLARAITNYPFYITNGNTPQGIHRWYGFEVSDNMYIGPTPNLQLCMPYECNAAVFFGDSSLSKTAWQKNMYASLLPDSWKNYDGIYESFYAGAIGRNEIIMHGTTIDPVYYKGQKYYPQTPSLGCLCSYEEWDENGNLIKSNQKEIADALSGINAQNGYVVVIDLNEEKRPVKLSDILPYMESKK